MKYKVCPDCGSHLDFGERCDCKDRKESREVIGYTKGGEKHGGYVVGAGRAIPRNGDRAVRAG